MKKILLGLITLLILTPSITFAENTCEINDCPIKSAPAPKLTEYFRNIDSVLSEIDSQISAQDSNILNQEESSEETTSGPSFFREMRGIFARGFNTIISPVEYFASFDYWVNLGLTNEIPSVVKRDNTKIRNYSEKIQRKYDSIVTRKMGEAVILNVCEGIDNCSLPEEITAQQLMSLLLKTNQNVHGIFRASLLEKESLTPEYTTLYIAPIGLEAEIKEYYNKEAMRKCSSCSGESFGEVTERIKNISNVSSGYKEGINAIRSAWNLIKFGKKGDDYYRAEEALLAQYLQTQGLDGNQAQQVLGNLEKYNQGAGLSSSNVLSNTSYGVVAEVNEFSDSNKTFLESVLEQFKNTDTVPIVELSKVNTQKKTSSDIQTDFNSLYQSLIPGSYVQETASQELQLRIIKMHYALTEANNMLSEKSKTIQEKCQTVGPVGNCGR